MNKGRLHDALRHDQRYMRLANKPDKKPGSWPVNKNPIMIAINLESIYSLVTRPTKIFHKNEQQRLIGPCAGRKRNDAHTSHYKVIRRTNSVQSLRNSPQPTDPGLRHGKLLRLTLNGDHPN